MDDRLRTSSDIKSNGGYSISLYRSSLSLVVASRMVQKIEIESSLPGAGRMRSSPTSLKSSVWKAHFAVRTPKESCPHFNSSFLSQRRVEVRRKPECH